MIRFRLAAALAVLFLGACAAPWAEKSAPPEASGPPERLGEHAVVIPPTADATPAGDESTEMTSSQTQSAAPSPADGYVAGSTGATPPPAAMGSITNFTSHVDDPTNDTGLTSRPYADLVGVGVVDQIDSAVVRVTFAGGIPATLSDGEVMGVGVDFWRSDTKESDYQVFATGRGDGWIAYLDTPGGFVDYPGSFRIEGSSLVFDLPWSALGGHLAAEYRAFADWSRPAVAVVAASSADQAPDDGRARLSG